MHHSCTHKGPTTASAATNTNAEENTLRHKVTMTNAPNVEKKTMTQPAKRKPAAEAVVNAPPMTEGPTERIAWSAREARRRSFVVFVFVFVAVIVVEVGVFSNNDSLSCSRSFLSLSPTTLASSLAFFKLEDAAAYALATCNG